MCKKVLCIILLLASVGCSVARTSTSAQKRKENRECRQRNFKFSYQEKQGYRRAGRIQRKILNNLGSRKDWNRSIHATAGRWPRMGTDSVFEKNYAVYERIFLQIDSVFRNHYAITDTIGAQRRFELATSPMLRKAIEDYCANDLDAEPYTQLFMRIFEKDGKHYLDITDSTPMFDVDGYLIYDGQYMIQIQIDDRVGARMVLNIRYLKRRMYERYLPVGRINGPSPYSKIVYYEITGNDKMRFIKRESF